MDGEMPPPPKRRTEVSSAWEARFPGYCTGCNLTIHMGQRIVCRKRFIGDRLESESYVHEWCA